MFRRLFIASAVFVMVAIVPSRPDVFAAQKYTIKEMTPGVMSALENRRNRYDELAALKRQGKIGENNRGYLEAFSGEEEIKTLVEAENRDRKTIYQTIAEQNNLQDAIDTIEKVFAQTQRDNAETGDKIQTQDGRWVTK